jgi:hypothetical protein
MRSIFLANKKMWMEQNPQSPLAGDWVLRKPEPEGRSVNWVLNEVGAYTITLFILFYPPSLF